MSGLVTAAAIKSVLSSVGGFFKSVPPAIWYGLAALLALAIGVHMHGNAVKRAYSAAYAQGSKDTSQAFQRAQAKADAAQLAKNAQTTAKQSKIDQEKSDALAKTDADIDARANAISVRHEAAVRRSQGKLIAVSAKGSSAGQSCPAATENGLPWSTAFPLMVQAQKNEAQLNAILDWEAAQEKVQP